MRINSDDGRASPCCKSLAGAFAAGVLAVAGAAHAAAISVGPTPASPPPAYLPAPTADAFYVPVRIDAVAGLSTWQFDLLFDPSVVQVVDPLDGSGGLYGAELVAGDASTLAFVLGGFTFNDLGVVDDLTGAYPASVSGAAGAGPLAYVLFQFMPGQDGGDPAFRIANASAVSTVPEPGRAPLLAFGLSLIWLSGRARRPTPPRDRRPDLQPTTDTPMTFRIPPAAALLAAACSLLLGSTSAGAATGETVAPGPYYALPSWDQTLASAQRFIVLSNMNADAVLDRETGLVWEKKPDTAFRTWAQARPYCLGKASADGWAGACPR